MAIELASTYVSVGLSTEGLHKQIRKAFGDAGGQATKEFGKGFSGVKDVFKGALGANVVTGAVSSITSGLGSYVGAAKEASDATDKFKSTLGFADKGAAEIEKLTRSAQKYADLTVYDLSDIQSITAQLAANGVKDFDKLAEAAGNLNAVAGGNKETFASVGMVLTQTAGAGKLTGENWRQLSDAIPGASGKIKEALLKNKAYTGEFSKALSDGQVSAEEFNQAILDLGFEEAAVKAAQSTSTFEGAWGNFEAAIEGGLANILSVLKPFATGALNAITSVIEPVFAGIASITKKVAGLVSEALGKASGPLKTFKEEFAGGFRAFAASWQAFDGDITSAGFPGWMEATAFKLRGAWEEVTGGFRAFAASWQAFDGDITSAGFPGWMEATAFKLRGAWEGVKGAVSGFIEGFGGVDTMLATFKDALPLILGPLGMLKTALMDAFSNISIDASGMKSFGKQVGATLKPLIEVASQLAAGVSGSLGQAFAQLVPVMTKLGGAVGPLIGQLAQKLAPIVSQFVKGLIPPLQRGLAAIGDVIGRVADALAPLIQGIADRLAPMFMNVAQRAAPMLQKAFETIASVVELLSPILAELARVVSEQLGAAFQWLAPVVELVFNTISTSISVSLDIIRGIIDTAVAIIKGDWSGVWDAMKGTVTGVWETMKGSVSSAIETIRATISGVTGIIKRNWDEFWGGMKTAGQRAWDWISSTATSVFNKMVAPIRGSFESIKRAAGTIWGGIKSVITKTVNSLKSGVEGAFTTMKNNIGRIWDGVKAAVKAPIKFVVETVINKGLIGSFNSLLEKLSLGGLSISDVALPKGFAGGGWTGPGSKYQPAGIVHADEHVWTKEEMRKFPGGHKRMEQWRAAVRRGDMEFGMAGYASGGRVKAPFPGGSWNGGYYRSGKFHGGVDFPRPIGTPVRAPEDGQVVKAARLGYSYGIHAIIRGLWDHVLAHMSRMSVSSGQRVTQGQVIGAVGSTGNSTGPHLHWEVRPRGAGHGSAVNPLAVASGALAGGGGAVVEESPLDKLKGMLSGAAKKLFDFGKASLSFVTEFLKDPMGHITRMFAKAIKPSGGAGIIGQIVDEIPGKVADALKQYAKSVIGFAGGTTSAPPGLAWVGERGPELVRFRGGERVWSNSDSVQAVGAAAPMQITVNGIRYDSVDDFAQAIEKSQRRLEVRRRYAFA